jgi:hypothetical protein
LDKADVNGCALAKDANDVLPSLCQYQRVCDADSWPGQCSEAFSEAKLQDLWLRLFGVCAEEEDIIRWLNSTFDFVGTGLPVDISGNGQENLPLPWGLRQELGGPCGVFAAVQAFIVRELLWGGTDESCSKPNLSRTMSSASTALGSDSDSDSTATNSGHCPSASQSPTDSIIQDVADASVLASSLAQQFNQADRQDLLAIVLSRMLYGATPESRYVWAEVSDRSSVSIHSFSTAKSLIDWLVTSNALKPSHCPVMSFVVSLVLTRGIEAVRGDMDDPSAPLIGMFGHCSQELTNLCIVGRAVTNIFDGDVKFEDGNDVLHLKGIDKAYDIGFLTTLEPLKLCEVGSFLKQPRFPIWVVGSASHYTVLFSGSCALNHYAVATAGPCSQSDFCCGACRHSGTGVCGSLQQAYASPELLHFNGRDDGSEKPMLTRVQVTLKSLSSAPLRYEPGPLTGDQDSRLFGEVVNSRWPGAEVVFPQQLGPPRLT